MCVTLHFDVWAVESRMQAQSCYIASVLSTWTCVILAYTVNVNVCLCLLKWKGIVVVMGKIRIYF